MAFQHNHLCYHTVTLMFLGKECAKSRFFFQNNRFIQRISYFATPYYLQVDFAKVISFLTGFS